MEGPVTFRNNSVQVGRRAQRTQYVARLVIWCCAINRCYCYLEELQFLGGQQCCFRYTIDVWKEGKKEKS